MRFKRTMTTSSSNVDATTNLEKILATGRYRDGPPGRNVFLQISTGLPYLSYSHPQQTSLREQIHTDDFDFQFSMCVEESNLLFLVVFQHKDWLFLSIEYTSSDNSELSKDETGPDVKRFVTKRLAWEGLKLRALKDVLDLAHKRLLKPHVRNFQTERVVGKRFSSRGAPSVATSTPARGR